MASAFDGVRALGTPAGTGGAPSSYTRGRTDACEDQQIKLAWIAAADPKLYRAYLLKEGLRLIFAMPYAAAIEALERWISRARRCRIPSFVKLQKSIVKHRARILAAIEHNLSNGLIESANTKIWLLTRMAFGFKSPEALIVRFRWLPNVAANSLTACIHAESDVSNTTDCIRSVPAQAG